MREFNPPEAGNPNPEGDFDFLDESIVLAIQMLKKGSPREEIFSRLTVLTEEVRDSVIDRAQYLVNTKREYLYLDDEKIDSQD